MYFHGAMGSFHYDGSERQTGSPSVYPQTINRESLLKNNHCQKHSKIVCSNSRICFVKHLMKYFFQHAKVNHLICLCQVASNRSCRKAFSLFTSLMFVPLNFHFLLGIKEESVCAQLLCHMIQPPPFLPDQLIQRGSATVLWQLPMGNPCVYV